MHYGRRTGDPYEGSDVLYNQETETFSANPAALTQWPEPLAETYALLMKKKATEDQFNELHNLVTKEFLARIKSGEASTADLKAACDWLKTNDISGVQYDSNPLDKLANLIPQVDPELVQTRLYGSRKTKNPGRTTRYYRKNPKAYRKKLANDTKENRSPKDKKYRRELAMKAGLMGKRW